MAINFSVSFTFSPSTTISSSQVNTNFSDEANVWIGLEAETKTMAKLKMDADPTVALEVATKQYVDHYSAYRRPVLQYSSATVVNLEAGLTGTSGQAQILFTDGTIRTDSTTSRINLDVTRNAVLSGAAQSGIRTGSVAQGWWAVYAVKVTDSSTNFVTVACQELPLQANFATLNSNFGTSGWVYLGLVRYGDNSGATTVILTFVQAGYYTSFYNAASGSAVNGQGIRFSTSASAASINYAVSRGVGVTDVPQNVSFALWGAAINAGGTSFWTLSDGTGQIHSQPITTGTQGFMRGLNPVRSSTVLINGPGSSAYDMYFVGLVDGALGIGSNPLL